MIFDSRGTNSNYYIHLVSGDTEYIRLNVRDVNGDIIVVGVDNTAKLGIKKNSIDTDFLIPEIDATMYEYDEFEQPYSIEFKLSGDDTAALLNYDGKERNKLLCVYDVEFHNTFLGIDERTTLLAGTIEITRSISGKVI